MRKLRKKISGFLCLLLAGYLFFSLSVNASEVANSQEINTTVETTRAQAGDDATSAHEWGLSAAEWSSYEEIMHGPNRLWYPQLSPVAVLGLNAATEKERQHFAELFAQQEHDKVARELMFNHAVYLAMRKLYPVEPIIQPFDKTPFNPRHLQGNQPWLK